MIKYLFKVIFVFVLFSCEGNDERIFPEIREITESVYASVTIQPDSLYQAYATVNGLLEENLVEEGDRVNKGDPLVQIINNSPRLNSENARLSLQLARENYQGSDGLLNSIKKEIIAANLQLSNDSINYFRQKKLWENKIGSKAEIDARELAYQLSSNSLKILKNKYKRTEKELKTQLQQAENDYQNSLIKTTDFTVSSKISGTVYALHKQKGELVTTAQPLATLGSEKDFVIEMLIDEQDIVKISTGLQVMVVLDAYKDELFLAKVSKIYPKKDERNQTFKVEALFDKAPNVLYPGLSGEANIIINRKKEALVIPKNYLVDDNKVQTDSGIVRITTGLESLDSIEVLSGLDSETAIYKPKND